MKKFIFKTTFGPYIEQAETIEEAEKNLKKRITESFEVISAYEIPDKDKNGRVSWKSENDLLMFNGFNPQSND